MTSGKTGVVTCLALLLLPAVHTDGPRRVTICIEFNLHSDNLHSDTDNDSDKEEADCYFAYLL